VHNLGLMCDVAHRMAASPACSSGYSGGNAPSLESRDSDVPRASGCRHIRHTLGVRLRNGELDIRTVINMYVEAGKLAGQARAHLDGGGHFMGITPRAHWPSREAR